MSNMIDWSEMLICWRDSGCQTVTLYNCNNVPVGALYLNQVDLSKIIITIPVGIDEKYYLYFNGIAIFFSFIRKN